MSILRATLIAAIASLGLAACSERAQLPVSAGIGPNPELPPPNETWVPTVNVATATGWPAGAAPDPAPGLAVSAFAEGLDHPRWLYVLPNGDVLVAETNAPPRPERDRGIKGWVMGIVMGWAGDGVVDQRTVFLDDLHSPFGMALVVDRIYVANTGAVVSFPYEEGQTEITAPGTKVSELPGGPLNHHWTKNLIASPSGELLYASVGSNSNVAENGLTAERGRAAIWEIDPATGRHRVFASGLRNPVGMAWEPQTGVLWTVVNERDELGSDLVPDYLTSVEDGGFYGWPWSYYGGHVDERVEPQRPDLVAQAIVPDYALGAHTASLGLTFAEGNSLPATFANGAFVGQHGSWNRNPPSGYKVIFVPFEDGGPEGDPIDVLTGFLADGEARGRPVGVAIDGQGALLVADDVGNTVWRVTSAPTETAALD
jgi:glucose/arabinose dehydrogenase